MFLARPSRTHGFTPVFLVGSLLFIFLVFYVVLCFCSLLVIVLYLACPMLPVFLDYPFMINFPFVFLLNNDHLICSLRRSDNIVLCASFGTYHRIFNKSNTTSATCEPRTVCPSGGHLFIPPMLSGTLK